MINTDESDLFKDEDIHYKSKQSANNNIPSQNKKKNQTIISIYGINNSNLDRIANNNESDPLYPKRPQTKYHHYSTVTSARNSRHNIDKCICMLTEKKTKIRLSQSLQGNSHKVSKARYQAIRWITSKKCKKYHFSRGSSTTTTSSLSKKNIIQVTIDNNIKI